MDELKSFQYRIQVIKDTLKITEMNEKEIDKALENWLVDMLQSKLKEKGWLNNEKQI